MEKRMFGVLLTILGIAGLIAAAWYYVNSGAYGKSLRAIVVFAVLGVIFFTAGIGLIKRTRDTSG